MDNDAIKLMYNALMSISYAYSQYFPDHKAASARAREIADRAISEVNTKHTAVIQQALGLTAEPEVEKKTKAKPKKIGPIDLSKDFGLGTL